jgi:hypothetical protein
MRSGFYGSARGGELKVTSVLTHVGGLTLGLAGARVLPPPRHVWIGALGALLALGLVTRLTTPVPSNVNLAFSVWPGWETYFPSHFWYMVMILSLCGATFLVAESLLRTWIGTRSEGAS